MHLVQCAHETWQTYFKNRSSHYQEQLLLWYPYPHPISCSFSYISSASDCDKWEEMISVVDLFHFLVESSLIHCIKIITHWREWEEKNIAAFSPPGLSLVPISSFQTDDGQNTYRRGKADHWDFKIYLSWDKYGASHCSPISQSASCLEVSILLSHRFETVMQSFNIYTFSSLMKLKQHDSHKVAFSEQEGSSASLYTTVCITFCLYTGTSVG